MKKELKDYLHFYLGCEVLVTDTDGQTFKDKIEEVFDQNDGKGFSIYEFGKCPFDNHEEYYQEIKPILRPLSDMTDEEVSEAELLEKNKLDDEDKPQILNYALMTKYLLSKHFDLFGLIEAGLAVDKTTLK